ncbi:MAG: hypothetical protein ACT4QD_13130 [Acidobacteriota bacterium]
MTVTRLPVGEIPSLQDLIHEYAFKPYRNYRVLPRQAQTAVLMAEIESTANHDDGMVWQMTSGLARAVAVSRRLRWDSEFFGVRMGRIEYLMASDAALAAPALAHAIEALAEKGVRHVSARVDVADVESMHVFEASGFRLMDALVTYTTRPRKEPPNPVRQVGTIRPFQSGDRTELLQIAAEAYAGFRGRFHLDAHLAKDRCDAFYAEWAAQCLSGAMADMLLVSEGGDGRLLGFLAFKRREPVSTVGGVPVFGGGLGACRRDSPGAYAGLIRAGTVWAHEHNGVAECQTQNYNFSTIRIYEAVGAHYVRAEYTLHRWLE